MGFFSPVLLDAVLFPMLQAVFPFNIYFVLRKLSHNMINNALLTISSQINVFARVVISAYLLRICKDINISHNIQLHIQLNARFQFTLVKLFVAFLPVAVSLHGHRAHLFEGEFCQTGVPWASCRKCYLEKVRYKSKFLIFLTDLYFKGVSIHVIRHSVYLSDMTALKSAQHNSSKLFRRFNQYLSLFLRQGSTFKF